MQLYHFLLAFLGLFQRSVAQDCGAFLINDCQRDVCSFRNEENVGSVALCQLLCEIGSVDGENCQSWAYHQELKVIYCHCSFESKINDRENILSCVICMVVRSPIGYRLVLK